MTELKDFFAASVGSAAALIGLLFVAITLAPDKVFGADADERQHGQAVGAFSALANIFFVSLAALIPVNAAPAIVVIGGFSIARILREGVHMSRQFPRLRGLRFFGLISLVIYVLEIFFALRFAFTHRGTDGLVYVVLGLYAYALGTSWTLLAARGVKS